jgi:hypothetical protein
MTGKSAAEEPSRMLETGPMRLRSLKSDHATLVAKLEALMPFIETLATGVDRCCEAGRTEQIPAGVEAFQRLFARALNVSAEDSQAFCVCAVMMRIMAKYMRPLLESMAEKRRWEQWFETLWEKKGGENG